MPRHWWYLVGFIMIVLGFFLDKPVTNGHLLGAVGILLIAMYRMTEKCDDS